MAAFQPSLPGIQESEEELSLGRSADDETLSEATPPQPLMVGFAVCDFPNLQGSCFVVDSCLQVRTFCKAGKRRPRALVPELCEQPVAAVPHCPAVPRIPVPPAVKKARGRPQLSMDLCSRPSALATSAPPPPPRGSLQDADEAAEGLACLEQLATDMFSAGGGLNYLDFTVNLLDMALGGKAKVFDDVSAEPAPVDPPLPSVASIAPCSLPGFRRRLKPREPAFGEEPFPVDCLPSAPVSVAAPPQPTLRAIAERLAAEVSADAPAQELLARPPATPRSARQASRPQSRCRLSEPAPPQPGADKTNAPLPATPRRVSKVATRIASARAASVPVAAAQDVPQKFSAMALDLGFVDAAPLPPRSPPHSGFSAQEAYVFSRPPKLGAFPSKLAGGSHTKAAILPAIARAPSAGAVAWRVDLHRAESRRCRPGF